MDVENQLAVSLGKELLAHKQTLSFAAQRTEGDC